MEETTLPIASNAKRVASFVIDDVVVNLFLMIIFSSQIADLMSKVKVVDETAILMINQFIVDNILIIFAIKVLYHGILIWQTGMTVGKYLLKIKTVDLGSGRLPSLTQAFWRASVRLVSEMFFYLGFVFAFFSPLHQTLHDKLSNCVVIDV